MHYQASPLSYTRSIKTICLKLSANSYLQSFLQMAVSVVTMQLICVSMAIMQVTMLHFGRFSGFTFCYWYDGGSFCNNYASDCFCCSYAVKGFCSTYAGDSFCSKYMGDNFYCNYADGSLCWNYADGIFCSALCT